VDHRDLLRALVDAGASDLHCKPGSLPVLRIGGDLVRHGDDALDPEDVATYAQAMLDGDQQAELIRSGSVVGAHSEPGVGRFRVAAYRQRSTVSLVIHVVPHDVPKLDDLGLPTAAATLAASAQGLVLVASPVGNGATTTLAALVDHVNSTRRRHVVTVEDPVEVLHTDVAGMVSQLEVGAEVASLADGIRAASKIDADVIAVSDIATRETASAVLDAVARGRAVLAAVAGDSAISAIHTFLELFTVEERSVARAAFARAVSGIIAQRLLPSLDGSLVPAVEVLVRTPKIEACIADEDRLGDLRALLDEGEYHGMQTMDSALARLVRAGRIDADTALAIAADPEDLRIELLR
jgi:twitching motility protein PilT